MNGTTLTHVCRHQADNVTNTSTAFKYVAATKTQGSSHVPHGIYHGCGGIVRTVAAHVGSLVGFGGEQLSQSLVDGVDTAVRTACHFTESLS